MSRLQCYDAFVKATNDIGIGMQDRWIADEDWVHHIRNQDELKDCNVSHMNHSISSKEKVPIYKQLIHVSRK
jgi:hypothetical protein